jgi:hypothetical protein
MCPGWSTLTPLPDAYHAPGSKIPTVCELQTGRQSLVAELRAQRSHRVTVAVQGQFSPGPRSSMSSLSMNSLDRESLESSMCSLRSEGPGCPSRRGDLVLSVVAALGVRLSTRIARIICHAACSRYTRPANRRLHAGHAGTPAHAQACIPHPLVPLGSGTGGPELSEFDAEPAARDLVTVRGLALTTRDVAGDPRGRNCYQQQPSTARYPNGRARYDDIEPGGLPAGSAHLPRPR